MNTLVSKTFPQFLSTYTEIFETVRHSILGNFSVLQNQNGIKILKKTITVEQLDRFDFELFQRYEKLFSENILQFKGITEEKCGSLTRYAIFYEYFEETLREEIEKKAHPATHYNSQEVLHILKNISSALSCMQNSRLVHSEVKSDYIVRMGNEYKLINPIIFGRPSHFYQESVPIVPKRPIKTISPEIVNAIHRDIIDPVHEDFKDDVYGLGLVALELMTLRVEAPIPVEKKIERASFFYSNSLIRLVKKMVESVMTLRMDPLACQDHVDKMLSQKQQDPPRPALKHNRNFSMINFQVNLEKEKEYTSQILKDCQENYNFLSRKQSISQTALFKGDESTRADFNSRYGMSPNEAVPTVSISLFDEKDLDTSKENSIGQDYHQKSYLPQTLKEKEAELIKLKQQYTNWMKSSGSIVNSRGEGGLRERHVRSGSAAYSGYSTNSTYYSKPQIKEGLMENKSNVSDLLYMSVLTRDNMDTPDRLNKQKGTVIITESESMCNVAQSSGNTGNTGHTLSSGSKHGGIKEFHEVDVTDFVNKAVVPSSKKKIQNSGSYKKKSADVQETETTPRFKEKEKCLGKIINHGVSQSRITTSRRLYKGPEKQRKDTKNILCTINLDNSSNIQESIIERDSVQTIPSICYSGEKSFSQQNEQITKEALPFSGKRILKFRTKSSGNLSHIMGMDARAINHEKARVFVRELENCLDVSKYSSENNSYTTKRDPESKSFCIQQLLGDRDLTEALDNTPQRIKPHSRLTIDLEDYSNKRLFQESKEFTNERQEASHKEPQSFKPVNLQNYFSESVVRKSNSQASGNAQKPKTYDPQPRQGERVIQMFDDGSRYEGEMFRNLRHGHGKIIYADDKYFEGEWNAGKINGYGTLYNADGSIIYEGRWKDGKYHGQGLLINPRVTKLHLLWENQPKVPPKELGAWIQYKGDFKQGLWEGFGELLLVNGDHFIGKFENNKTEGKGKYKTKNGKIWEGEWQSNYLKLCI